jgi:ribonuclease E
MAKRMLIDASHPEETRVVVQSGDRLEDFDYETTSRKQLKGNIYLAKVTRVEPSLQAAFVDYGGNRHGFLPFSEIHPDYYRIPIADREALLAEEAALKAEPADEAPDDAEVDMSVLDEPEEAGRDTGDLEAETAAGDGAEGEAESADDGLERAAAEGDEEPAAAEGEADVLANADDDTAQGGAAADPEQIETEERVDTVGGDDVEEAARRRAQLLRRYKIQEVIKRRQVMLVQVTKEERGTKGAALTTYLSLPGRYCVLMPNTNKGGGISRKISNAGDRRRLKAILADLDIPEGIAVIVRTAGSQRTKVEIRRDYEYLLRLWDSIRQQTLQSTAPALIYEEANLIKRAIRDLYSRDMDEVLVDGEEGYKAAKDFMKSLTPSHAKKVKQYKDASVPLFQRYQVESQLDAMHSNTVQLRSGGYLVINQTEALVAIDVNSGRATRERHIEETALKTNLEAAEEVGRQLRLRDLAGLIVIDFIDMEESRRNREVERRLKEALRSDRARIQLGRISPFGLLEMSRQRMRPSLFESSTESCPYCGGDGRIRTVESLALQVLRRLEEEGIREPGGEMTVTVPTKVALYLLNRKRDHVVGIEQRYDFRVLVETDDHLATDAFTIERDGSVIERRAAPAEERREAESEDGERKRGRRRRARRRKDEETEPEALEAREHADEADEAREAPAAEAADEDQEAERQRKRKRRGKRGGRRRSRRRDEEPVSETSQAAEEAAEAADGDAAVSAEAAESRPEATAESRGEAVHAAESPGEAPSAEEADAETEDRRRRGRRRAKPAASEERESAAETAAAPAVAADEAESEEKAKPEGRRRGARGRGTRGGRGRGGTIKTDKDVAEAEAPGEVEAEPAAPAETAPAEAAGDAPQPQAGTEDSFVADRGRSSLRDISATDPKVVIEPAKPSAPPAGEAAVSGETAGDQEISTMEPPREEEKEQNQPKRRGWWNRFM